MNVIVDGVEYVPAGMVQQLAKPYSMGIGVTTKDRWPVLETTLHNIIDLSPAWAEVVVVVDGGELPTDEQRAVFPTVKFAIHPESLGIAAAKNRCLEELELNDHIFLFDDDAYPLSYDWYKPYVASREPHLMRIFPDLSGVTKLNDLKVVSDDGAHVAYTGPRGVMLYVERRVLEIAGGMDVAFGRWGWEHGDWSNRIHSFGLTTWRFADVAGSEELIYCLDEHEKVDRSLDWAERRDAGKRNIPRYIAQYDLAEYREFRRTRSAYLTCLYTLTSDPQRRRQEELTPAALNPLITSLGGQQLEILTDTDWEGGVLTGTEPKWIKKPRGVENLYIQRWAHYLEQLEKSRDIGFAWLLDGTDVVMLRQPEGLSKHLLYLGTEHTTIGCDWMRQSGWGPLVELIQNHPDLQLYNAGIVGGHRDVLIPFLRAIVTTYEDSVMAEFHGRDNSAIAGVNDMGILNVVARRPEWAGRIISGPQVNTVFKGDQHGKEVAWFAHK